MWRYGIALVLMQADLTREEIVRLDQTNPFSLTQLGPEGPHNSTNISLAAHSLLPSQSLRASRVQLIECVQGGDEPVVLRQWQSRLRRSGSRLRLH